jgi:DNA topoisomerase-1
MSHSIRNAYPGEAAPEANREAAQEIGLRYVSDRRPGITRLARDKHFIYRAPGGKRLGDAATLARIKRLAIPPAWTNVWICPYGNGHIQATGRDPRGRKQYRYHARWREQRDENKFERMLGFAKVLPRIRRRVARDLKKRGMPREKVLATVVRLLEVTLIRVGNDEYARSNNSYGLTTMRNRHVRVTRGNIEFSFRGKSGKRHEISVHDPQLAKIVRRCQDMPGQELFEYEAAEGDTRDITSEDVNAYLREITGEEYTAKDFRTWAGTVLAAIALRQFEGKGGRAKKNIVTAVEAVAQMLGNTPAVCRKCYIHPEILNSYLAGQTIAAVKQRLTEKMDKSLSKLKPEEAAVMILLQSRLNATVKKTSPAN